RRQADLLREAFHDATKSASREWDAERPTYDALARMALAGAYSVADVWADARGRLANGGLAGPELAYVCGVVVGAAAEYGRLAGSLQHSPEPVWPWRKPLAEAVATMSRVTADAAALLA